MGLLSFFTKPCSLALLSVLRLPQGRGCKHALIPPKPVGEYPIRTLFAARL